MSSENIPYDEVIFKKSIEDAIKHCSTIRNGVRHYKMHLMGNLLNNSIKIDAHGKISSTGRKTIQLKDILAPHHGITTGPKDMSIYYDNIRKEGMPLLIKNYFINQSFHADHYNYIDQAFLNKHPGFLVRGGDILMIQKGEQAGSCTVLPLTHAESLLGPECIRIAIIHDRYDVFFIINVLHYYYYRNASVLKQPDGIDPHKLITLPIPAFELGEQKNIALQMLELSAHMAAQDTYRKEMEKLNEYTRQ